MLTTKTQREAARLTGEQLAERGYCVTSRAHRMIARIDRPDWKDQLAKELRTDYEETLDAPHWKDFYRRVLSKDKLYVDEEKVKSIPKSSSCDIGYVDLAKLKPAAKKPFNFNEYAEWTDTYWKGEGTVGDPTDHDLAVIALGLAGESGEVVDHIKKTLRDGKPYKTEDFLFELGDVLFYWARLCRAAGVEPLEVMKRNVLKIEARYGKK